MPPYIAFMRAINVTGRFIKMAALADHYRALGYTEVSTFINTGTVLYQADEADDLAALESRTQTQLEALLGFRSEVFLRRPEQVRAIAKQAGACMNPTAHEVNVAFLKAPLDATQQQALLALQSEVDTFEAGGTELYWTCRVKQSESRFSNAVLERKLGLKSTFRRASMLDSLVSGPLR
jgi:uncharacterized protein (DUF1697 family)